MAAQSTLLLGQTFSGTIWPVRLGSARQDQVSKYELYFLDREGRIALSELIEARGKADAVKLARDMFRQRQHYTSFEVCERARLVHQEKA